MKHPRKKQILRKQKDMYNCLVYLYPALLIAYMMIMKPAVQPRPSVYDDYGRWITPPTNGTTQNDTLHPKGR